MPSVLISGALGNKPFNGGNAWSRLSWVLGFRRLGYEVCFVEQIAAANCVDAGGAPAGFRASANLQYFAEVMETFGLTRHAALLCDNGADAYGLSLAELRERARQAQLLFNLSGHLTWPELLELIPCRVYYDDDPGFTQFWHAAGNAGAHLDGHHFFFTIGENIGAADCPIPTDGIAWRHTRPPVVLEKWPAREQAFSGRFTTIASWRGAYGPIEYKEKRYGLKVHEFRKFFELPRRCNHQFEIALQIHPADGKDLEALRAHGWHISDPRAAADTPTSFADYVRHSAAEFSVAQGVYVDTRSGWFSDRTVRYLASGRPALVQDTGFGRNYPTGEGLLAFHTMEEAVEGANRIAADYQKHCQAARRIAEEFFDSDQVIRRLLAEIGLP